MGQWKFHTPAGVNDLLPEACQTKRKYEAQLRRVFSLRGYEEIETPSMEFYDVYEAGSGSDIQEALFKFSDEQGRILCLRYDGTVPVARLAATVHKDKVPPLRYAYIGNMYRYKEYGGGRLREFSQAGVELLGDVSPDADAEVIATAISAAKACGIEDLQVSIGQVAFFKALLNQWEIKGEDAELLLRFINSKDMVALEDLFIRLALPDQAKQIFVKMATGYEEGIIDELRDLIDHSEASAALDNLQSVLSILNEYGYEKYVSVDLGMLQSINYYSGIIFKGYTYGIGFPLFSGGRYDHLVGSFGRDLAATGFSIGVNFVLAANRRQGTVENQIAPVIHIGHRPAVRRAAFHLADEKRGDGQRVICVQTDSEDAESFFSSYRQSIQGNSQAKAELAYIDDQGKISWEGENQ